MPDVAVIADDLTGAADAGAAFAAAGFSTAILFGDERTNDARIAIRSTETRERDAKTAVARTAAATRALLQAECRPGLLFKKIDSALRGHPCEELLTVMAESGCCRAVIAPALPAQGRVTRGGRVYIHGKPLAGTDLGREVGTSDLTSIFGCTGVPARLIGLDVVRRGAGAVRSTMVQQGDVIWLADAETDDDLRAIADGAIHSDISLLAGSAGLASKVVGTLQPGAHGSTPTVAAWRDGPVLVVAGSRHAATAAQVEALGSAGIPVVTPTAKGVNARDVAVDALCMALDGRRTAVLTAPSVDVGVSAAPQVAGMLAEIVFRVSRRAALAGLVLTGGDIAAAVLERLGASRVTLAGEVEPGVPWGTLRSRALPDMPIVTKAGSFGALETLRACVEFLHCRASEASTWP